jgi:hypothetical protein
MNDGDAIRRINKLSIPPEEKEDMLEQYIEDCDEYSPATADEKLATAIRDLDENNS